MKSERRKTPRVETLSEKFPSAEVRASHNQSIVAKCLNLSRHGALLELDRRGTVRFRVDEQVSVKLRLPQDVVWVAGIVRHCYGSRLGVFFPAGVGKALNSPTHISRKASQLATHRRAPQEILQAL
ncbi:PilZ domain-containing protein [Candidatus Nitronereus thalassa]|uniref:PilZ domain-containing protein n=1 Tax=Candidatus Nitronereus thalassa TaxID=3020898 RepID=A0ABU3KAN9_9BACT|nr:PilZ domain-containing protein [Candidatus Nitronereus thalassa]MDT7043459.1 PilZ domain-containing protein [Candidatus Nitronereus thalassa]